MDKISFKITEELIDAFARFTSDQSSLHVNKAAAAQSAYHQRVVHGMLPVSALGLLEKLHQSTIKKISGRFLHPVYVDETVRLELDDDLSFKIFSSANRGPVTTGTLVLQKAEFPDWAEGKISRLTNPLQENQLELEDLKKGHTEEFSFDTIAAAYSGWAREINKHQGDGKIRAGGSCGPEMSAVMLASTMVGMRLPGRRAAFLEFSVDFEKPLKPDTSYIWKASIAFISLANRVIIEDISITSSHEDILARGKLTVKMDEPTKPLPQMQELKSLVAKPLLKNKVVLITGASRGIGATTARLFACHGAKVIINYNHSAEEAKKVADDILAHQGNALCLQADIAQDSQVKAMMAEALEHFGHIDILVNNAVSDYVAVPFLNLTWEKIQRDLDVMAKGAFSCCQTVVPSMIKRGGGYIINLGTVATEAPSAGHLKYVLAKSALVGVTRALAVELAPHNIQVKMAAPSLVETDLTKTIPPAIREKIRQQSPNGKLTSTVDVAQAIVSLCRQESHIKTGETFTIYAV